MKVYTRTGDDGSTGLFYGGRVPKDSPRPWAYGTVDEAQAHLGVARSLCRPGDELDGLLTRLCHDLYVLMAELATLPENHVKLVVRGPDAAGNSALLEQLEREVHTRLGPVVYGVDDDSLQPMVFWLRDVKPCLSQLIPICSKRPSLSR